jgi:hypothetical protein
MLYLSGKRSGPPCKCMCTVRSEGVQFRICLSQKGTRFLERDSSNEIRYGCGCHITSVSWRVHRHALRQDSEPAACRLETLVSALVTFQWSDSPADESLDESPRSATQAGLATALELRATPKAVLAHYAKARYHLTLAEPMTLKNTYLHCMRATGI